MEPRTDDDIGARLQGVDKLRDTLRRVAAVRVEHHVQGLLPRHRRLRHQVVEELADAVPLPVPGLDERARAPPPGDLQGRVRGLPVHDPDADPVPGLPQAGLRDPVDHASDALFFIEGREEDHDVPARFSARVLVHERLDSGRTGTPEDPVPPGTLAHGFPPSRSRNRESRSVGGLGPIGGTGRD